MRFMPVFTGQESWTTGTHRGCSNFLWTTLPELVASYPCTRSSTAVPVLVPVVLYSVYMHKLNRKWILLSRSHTSSEVMTSEILARKRDVVWGVYDTRLLSEEKNYRQFTTDIQSNNMEWLPCVVSDMSVSFQNSWQQLPASRPIGWVWVTKVWWALSVVM